MKGFKKNKRKILIKEYLPHNFLAEKMILSCLLVNSKAIQLTLENIPIEAFYFINHQEIYKAIITIYEKNSTVDILGVTVFLQENGLLEKVGGIKVLLELINEIPNLIYLQEYIRLVKEKFLRRSLIKLSYQIINSSYSTNIPVESIFYNLETELFNFNNEVQTEKLSTSTELVNDILDELKKKVLKPVFPGVVSGFYSLDLLTQGFQKSDLIIIAGRPSMGKTALSLNIVLNVMKTSKSPILFFSLEMSKHQIMYRLLSMESTINQTKLKSGDLSKYDWLKLQKITKIMSKLPFFIDDSVNLSIKDIRSKIKSIISEQKSIGLVVIDYLQLMQNSEFNNFNRVQEISYITRSLKNIAREFNIPVIVLSQLSRNVENRINQKPILSDLRESGSIEQDADLILMLYNKKIENTKSKIIELIIAKQRNGPVGSVKLKFNNSYTKFIDINSQ
jgi:replicative DNA helicase